MKKRLDRFLHHPHTELALIGLILLSVGLLIVEIGLDREGKTYGYVHLAGEGITFVFIVELLIRFWVAPKKNRFFRYYWVDIVSVLPVFRPLRFLRVVRLLRLHRVGILVHRRMLARDSALAAGFGVQLMVVLIIGIIVLVGGLLIHVQEGGREGPAAFRSLSGAMWWSLFTLAAGEPVGGEPGTELGRLVAAFVVIGGLGTVAVFTGVMSAVMVQRLKSSLEMQDVDLDELREHIVICGWNRAAHLIIQELQHSRSMGHQPIVAVAELAETPESELKEIDRTRVFFHKGDYTTMDVLEAVGIRNASHAILLADKCKPRSDQDRDARTVLAALTIEKMNPKIFTCAQLLDRKNSTQLQVAGVENIVVDDEISGTLIATGIRNRGLIGVITELLAGTVGNNLYKVTLPKEWAGLQFGEASQRLKEKHEALLVGLEVRKEGRRATDLGQETVVNPPHDYVLKETDDLVLIARERPKLG